MGYDRQKLQDTIFEMYASVVESEKRATNAPVSISILRNLITGGGTYLELEYETELNYLIDSGYFKRYATNFVIPTVNGMNKIWGTTSHLPQVSYDDSSKKEIGVKRGDKSWNYFIVVYTIILALAIGIISVLEIEWVHKIILILISAIFLFWLCLFNNWFRNKIVGIMSKSQEKIEKL